MQLLGETLDRAPACVGMLDVRLFANRAFSAASLVTFCLGGALFGAMILMPLYFQTVRGEGPISTGWLLIPLVATVSA